MSESSSLVDAPLIFVGGHSRTGTTMMQGLICRSPEAIDVTKECSYLRQLMSAYRLGVEWYRFHTYDYFDSEADFTRFHRGIVETYLEHVAARFGAGKTIVQKEPRMTPLFPDLAALLPGARFVVMTRDLRDVLASQRERGRKIKTRISLNDEIQRFVSTHRRLQAMRERLAGRLMYVRYEALACQPAETVERVGEFLDLALPAGDFEWPTKRRADEDSGSPLDGASPSRDRIGRHHGILPPKVLERLAGQATRIEAAVGFACFAADAPEDRERFPATEVLA